MLHCYTRSLFLRSVGLGLEEFRLGKWLFQHASECHVSPSLRVRAGGQHVPVGLQCQSKSRTEDSKTP